MYQNIPGNKFIYETFRINHRLNYKRNGINIMTKKSIPKPTESELEILQILWQHGALTVKSVNEIINEKREVGYTTTLKLMQIMNDKKLVERNVDERSHIYSAAIQEADIQKILLNKLLESAFRGSASKLVMSALGNSNPSKEELQKIRELINKIERG